jgi:hypothetical protein
LALRLREREVTRSHDATSGSNSTLSSPFPSDEEEETAGGQASAATNAKASHSR